MVPNSTASVVAAPVFIVHPITQESWDIGPLLQVMYVLNAQEPGRMAELLFDISRYVAAEQHSAQDTAARLRQTLARLEHLGAAFDSIAVHSSIVVLPPVMRAI